MTTEIRTIGLKMCLFQAAVQDRLNEQEGVPSVFNPPPSRPLQVNTADHRVYSYIVSRPQPRVGLETRMSIVSLYKNGILDAGWNCCTCLTCFSWK